MTPQPISNVLAAGDPPPVSLHNLAGTSRFLLTGDHSGCAIPASLGDLGISEAERARHIGWDIGVAGLGRALAGLLDATFVAQTYSRLVVDCNRDPAAPGAMPEVSDGTVVPANRALGPAARTARVAAVHAPYHAAIAAQLDARAAAGRDTIFVALHSFTPVFGGTARPWQVGVLHGDGDTRFGKAMLAELARSGDLVVGDNQPYAMDGTDHSVPRHCYPRDIPYLELEVRQDLIASAEQQMQWAERLAGMFEVAARTIS